MPPTMHPHFQSVPVCPPLSPTTRTGRAILILAPHPSGNKLCVLLRFSPSQGPCLDLEGMESEMAQRKRSEAAVSCFSLCHTGCWTGFSEILSLGPLSC